MFQEIIASVVVFACFSPEWPGGGALHHGGPRQEDVQGGQPGGGHHPQPHTHPRRGRQENQGTSADLGSSTYNLDISMTKILLA